MGEKSEVWTSLDSVQIAGKSSKELKDLAQQLLLHSETIWLQLLFIVTMHEQYPYLAKSPDGTLFIHSTSHGAMNSIPKKQGDKSLFMNNDNYYSSNSA